VKVGLKKVKVDCINSPALQGKTIAGTDLRTKCIRM